MDFKKHYRRRMKRLKASVLEPLEQSRAAKKMWKLMGAQGVLLHMARQGSWNVWLAFIVAVLSVAVFFMVVSALSASGLTRMSWFILLLPAALSAFTHFALWKSAMRLRSGLKSMVFKLYSIPMLSLMFMIFVGVVIVCVHSSLKWLLTAFQVAAS